MRKAKFMIAEIVVCSAIILLILGLALGPRIYQSVAGNRTFIDMTYNYTYGIVKLADGTIIEGKVENWSDYQDGDQLQITINGNTYLVHSMNATLMTKTR